MNRLRSTRRRIHAGALWFVRAVRKLAWFELYGVANFIGGMLVMATAFILPDLAKLAIRKFLAWALS